jgi:hypothetical protein
MVNDLTAYNTVKAKMRTGDLLLWRSRSLLGAAIRFFSKANVNHAGLVMRFAEYEGDEIHRFTTEALERGIILHRLSKRLEEYDGEVYWYPLMDGWDRAVIGERAMRYIDTPYDYRSLFRNIFGKVSANARELFCSEYCFICYGFSGKAPVPGDMPDMGIFKDPVKIL